MDTLIINPQIMPTILTDMSNYEFEWAAVGGNIISGYKKFDLGNTLNLSYPVALPTGSYFVYFRVKDLSTGIIYTQGTTMRVSDLFTSGWLVLGEDNDGYAQLDMVATPYGGGDTTVLKNITVGKGLPKLKGPKLIYQVARPGKDRIHLSTEDGSYLLERSDFSSGEDYAYSTIFFDPMATDKFVMTDMAQIMGSNRYAIIDGKIFNATSFMESEFYGNAANHYKGNYKYFNIGDKIGVNYKERSSKFIFYNTDEKRFVSEGSSSSPNGYCDSLKDSQSDKTIFTWKTGLDYVTTINSNYTTEALIFTILKDEAGKHYLYSYRSHSSYGVIKKKRYELTGATHLSEAKFFGHSNANTYLFYATDNQFYGYDYVRGVEYPLDLGISGQEITLYWHQVFNQSGMAEAGDNFYVAFCDPSKPKSTCGTLKGFRVLTNVNNIVIEEIQGVLWDNLCKVVSINFKAS